jgi:hypothetical protein
MRCRSRFRMVLLALAAALAISALGASAVFAEGLGKPTAETKPATNIVETGAELNGVVNPNLAETKYHFEYGTTTSYGKSTPEVSIGKGSAELAESQQIAGLVAGTAYHFRIVATNSNGTTDGKDATFTTLKAEVLPYLVPAPKTTGITFKTTAGTAQILYGLNWLVDCTSSSISGEFVTAKTIANTVVTLSGCKISGEPYRCGNVSEEEIKSEPLTGELGYLSKTEKTVGLMFGKEHRGEKSNERPVWATKVTCDGQGGPHGTLRGEVIAHITPVNKVIESPSSFALEAPYSNPLTKFEGGAEGQETKLFESPEEPVGNKFVIGLNDKLSFSVEEGAEIAA